MTIPRLRPNAAGMAIAVALLASSGCGWHGLNSLPLPGTAGGGPGHRCGATPTGRKRESSPNTCELPSAYEHVLLHLPAHRTTINASPREAKIPHLVKQLFARCNFKVIAAIRAVGANGDALRDVGVHHFTLGQRAFNALIP